MLFFCSHYNLATSHCFTLLSLPTLALFSFKWRSHAFDLPATTNSPSDTWLVECPNKDVRVKADYLGAKLRQLEQLNRNVEIGCRSSRMCDLSSQIFLRLPFRQKSQLFYGKRICLERGILQSTSCTLPYGQSCRCSKWFPTILSGYSFLAVEERVSSSKGFELKTACDRHGWRKVE